MDVTDKVIATNGVFTLEPGQTVNYKRLATAMFEWGRNRTEAKAGDEFVTLRLLSGGIALEVDMSWRHVAGTDDSWEMNVWSTDPMQYTAHLLGCSNWAEGISLFELDSVVSPMPETLSTELVVLESVYGKSYLTGIAIEYEGVAEGDFMR